MRKYIIILLSAVLVPTMTSAQDDLYFTPGKKKTNEQKHIGQRYMLNDRQETFYCGRDCDVDEYNRRGAFSSHYEVIDSDTLGNDIISFIPGDGTYPDSIGNDSVGTSYVQHSRQYEYDADEDFKYSRRMMAYDDYCYPYWAGSPWFCSPWVYRSSYWYWNDPWYWNYSFYWNDPWYWHHSWYWNDPWYWHTGHWGHYPHYVSGIYRGYAGTRNHGTLSPRRNVSSNAHSIARGVQNESNVRGQIHNTLTSRSGNFSGRRNYSPNTNNSYSAPSSFSNRSASFSGSSFSGGSRGGAGFSGGGGSRGGGSFGGRR